jgi:hypothetical protein
MVALCEIGGFENLEVRGVGDETVAVARSLVDVDDYRVMRVSRIELPGKGAVDPRVGPHRAKRLPGESGRLDGVDGDLSDVRARARREEAQTKGEHHRRCEARDTVNGDEFLLHGSPFFGMCGWTPIDCD